MAENGGKWLKTAENAENDQNWPFQTQNDPKIHVSTKKPLDITFMTQK